MEEKIYKILWTGGWDSTFMLLQLAEQDIEIQPYYIYDIDRKGNLQEQIAMKKILKRISQNKHFKAKINLPLIYDRRVILNDYKDESIEKSFNYLREKYKIGTQYLWFALLAKKLNTIFEMGIVACEGGKITKALEQEGVLNNGILDKEKSSKEIIDVFENAIFPILEYSKSDIKKMAKEKGWYYIMKHTWFCHQPFNSMPCGKCNPCKDAMVEGMSFRMPLISKIRYWQNTFFKD